jgi:hypothetical protein
MVRVVILTIALIGGKSCPVYISQILGMKPSVLSTCGQIRDPDFNAAL